MITADRLIWYASYGSNMLEERFLCYIRGGQPEGSKKKYPGCRDKTLPADKEEIYICSQLYFEYSALVKKGQTAYNVAVSDARIPPTINSLLTQDYTGKPGSCILVQATDNVKVKRVHLTILDTNMTVIEQGEANDNGDNYNWIYSATVLADSIAGCKVEVRVYDLSGNVSMKSVVIQ